MLGELESFSFPEMVPASICSIRLSYSRSSQPGCKKVEREYSQDDNSTINRIHIDEWTMIGTLRRQYDELKSH